MIRSYLITAWRNLVKNKGFSFVNGFGLAVSVAFIFLAGGFIWSEYQVNRNIQDNDRIYLLRSKWTDDNMGYDFTTLAPLGKALQENYPQLVENYYHHDDIGSIVSKGDKIFTERLQPGDTSFLRLFGFSLLYGNAATAFAQTNSLLLTASKALKYFGKTDVIGKTLTIRSFSGSKQDFVITGVLKELPKTTINAITGFDGSGPELFLPAASLPFFGRDQGFEAWDNPFIISYVQLKKGVAPEALQQPIEQLIKAHASPFTCKNIHVYATSVKDYYLQSAGGLPKKIIVILCCVGLFILVMAVVNFINITTGNSVTRLKEAGIRKVMGSSRRQLMAQFITESVVLALFSVGLALVIYAAYRTYFGNLLGTAIPALHEFPGWFSCIPLLMAIFTGGLAGVYPAFVLARQAPVHAVRGKLETPKAKSLVRHGLTGLQFTISIIVFIVAVVVAKQISYFLHSDLGYQKESLVTALVPRDWTPEGVQHMRMVRDEFVRMPQVEDASFSFDITDGGNGGTGVVYKAEQDSTRSIVCKTITSDEHFAGTYNIEMAAGTFFNSSSGAPQPDRIVINESAMKALGWKEAAEAISQPVKLLGQATTLYIDGVTRDFHLGSMRDAIRPLLFIPVNNTPLFRQMSFRLKSGPVSETIAALRNKWSLLFPDAPFDLIFMDDTVAGLYKTEIKMKKAMQAATTIAIGIVLLGVFGSVSLSITRRTKEAGIRKVLGARVGQIMLLFVGEFSGIMIAANLVAWPIALIILKTWLLNYAYRIPVTLMPFMLVGIVVSLLVSMVIVLLSLRLAIRSPVLNLRTE